MTVNLNEQLIALRAERDTLTARIKDAATSLFTDASKDLFEKHPKLNSFSWTQYTPYFNDGEPCEFSVYKDYITVTDTDGNVDDEICGSSIRRMLDTGKDWRGNPATPTELEVMGLDVSDVLDQFTDEEFLMMFSDHAKMTVYRDGTVESDICDHD